MMGTIPKRSNFPTLFRAREGLSTWLPVHNISSAAGSHLYMEGDILRLSSRLDD